MATSLTYNNPRKDKVSLFFVGLLCEAKTPVRLPSVMVRPQV